jgi:integrase
MTDYLDVFAAHGRSAGHSADNTICDWVRIIGRMLREVGQPPLEITTGQLVNWLAQPDWKPWTRITYRNAIRAYFRCLQVAGCRPDDPAAGLRPIRRPPLVPKPVTDEDLRLALARSDPWWGLVIVLAAFAGLRAAEIARLRREDITEESITVRSGKGGKDAILPCHPRIWALVADLPPGPVLTSPATGKPITGGYLSSRQSDHWRSIGLPHIHLHRFRHWYGTNLLRAKEHGGAGASMRTCQELLRHAALSSTAVYTQVSDRERTAAIGALSLAAA